MAAPSPTFSEFPPMELRLVHVDAIEVPKERARKDFDPKELASLRSSIAGQGLFHPLLLRPDGKTLVAGERRLRCLRDLAFEKLSIVFDGQKLEVGQVPVSVMERGDEIALIEAELAENVKRQNLTWQEESTWLDRLHRFRQEEYVDQKQTDTAQETGRSLRAVHESLAIAPWLGDKDVASAKSRKEALKVIEQKLEQGHREALAKRLGSGVEEAWAKLLQGDLRAVLPTLSGESFDCIIADPPYGVNAGSWDNQNAVQHAYQDDEGYSNELITCIATEGFRLCKADAHAYCFCDVRPHRFQSISGIFSAAGWRVWPWPLIWWRGPQIGLLPWPHHGPRRTYEGILFAIKGDRSTRGVFPDVLYHLHDGTEERGAHKPPGLYAELLRRSCYEGDRVLDPSAGTGPIFEAARGLGIRATGIEIEAAAYARAAQRIKGEE